MPRATGILPARKKSVSRGYAPKTPYSFKPLLVSCYAFKVRYGCLQIPVVLGRRIAIPLTDYVCRTISDTGISVRAFTLTPDSLSLCISKDVGEVECAGIVGVDRNLRNLTVGNDDYAVHHDLSRTVRIAETTTRIIGSFKRDDARIRKELSGKHGQRRRDRV